MSWEASAFVFWLPGYGAGVGVIMGLLFGCTGPAIVADKILFPPRTAWFLLGAISAASIISFCAYRVLRGYPKAPTRMNQLSTALLTFALAIFAVTVGSLLSAGPHFGDISLHGGDRLLSGIGVVASAVAKRLVAGPFYATLCCVLSC